MCNFLVEARKIRLCLKSYGSPCAFVQVVYHNLVISRTLFNFVRCRPYENEMYEYYSTMKFSHVFHIRYGERTKLKLHKIITCKLINAKYNQITVYIVCTVPTPKILGRFLHPYLLINFCLGSGGPPLPKQKLGGGGMSHMCM